MTHKDNLFIKSNVNHTKLEELNQLFADMTNSSIYTKKFKNFLIKIEMI